MKDNVMAEFSAKRAAASLNRASKQYRRDIDELNDWADHLCNDGQMDAAGIVRQMAGHLTILHGLGRTLKMQIEGVEITPSSGGK